MREQAIIETWRETLDLSSLKISFYGGDGEALWSAEEACQLVHARAAVGRLPHAVHATAELTQALLDGETENIPAETRANSFCTAWIRFVNGMTDTQQQYRSKQSMYRIARQLQLPASFIELRHRVTHEDKPKLHELQHATRQGLTWLYDWYWARLPKTPSYYQEADNRSNLTKNANETFEDQIKVVLDEMYMTSPGKCKEEGVTIRDTPSVEQAATRIAKLCRGTEESFKTLSQVLIQQFLSHPWSTAIETSLRTEKHWRASFLDCHYAPFHILNGLLLLLASDLPQLLLAFESYTLAEVARPDVRQAHPVRIGCLVWLMHIYTDSTWKRHSSWCLLNPPLGAQICVENTNDTTKNLLHELDKD